MKKLSQFLGAALCTGLLLFSSCSSDEQALDTAALDQPTAPADADQASIIPGEYLVIYHDGAIPDGGAQARVRQALGKGERLSSTEHASLYREASEATSTAMRAKLSERGVREVEFQQVYSFATKGFAARLSDDQVAALRADKSVKLVEPNRRVQLDFTVESVGGPTLRAQSTPYGITKIGGAVNYTGSAWAWIIDSGIDLDHPELNVNTANSRTFATGTSNADDQNGHGTHVAGTVAARNNTAGVVGVAAGATVVSVRVFDASGSSANSIIVAGIDYVAANAIAGDVANMSLGGGASTTTDNAVLNLASRGVHCAIAAGNSSRPAANYSPARVNGTRIWTVSSHDINDRFSSFSNYGNPPIDVCAPGSSVYSTYLNGGYATLSGTSMASPHVAGILMVNNGVVYSRGNVSRDRDRTADPLARR